MTLKYNKKTRAYDGKIHLGDLHQAVGFFEGEGSISITLSQNQFQGFVAVNQKEPELLEWFQGLFGGGLSLTKCGPRSYGPGTPIWRWQVSNHHGAAFLRTILPYLVSPRGRWRANIYLRFFSTVDRLERTKILLQWKKRRKAETG